MSDALGCDFSAFVEPRLGNAIGRWISFSSACRPLGLVNLSPDTRIGGDWGCGYNLADNEILGFSHIHDWQSGGILVMPVTDASLLADGPNTWKSPFSHEREVCKPGDHRVVLDRYAIAVELTATTRVGMHRYRFPNSNASLLVDLASQCGPCAMADPHLVQTSPTTLEGRVVNQPTLRKPKPHAVYFAMVFDRPVSLVDSQDAGAGRYCIALSQLGCDTCVITLKVGLSYTSVAAARENMAREAGGKSFDQVRDEARCEWNEWLSRIVVEGGNPVRRARFYTDLYFALLGRRIVSDCGGTYMDNTGPEPRVRQIPLDAEGRPRHRHFSSDAFWGAQWSLIPLWAIAYPELVDEFCRSFMDMARNGGHIPRGPAGGNDTFVMTSAQTTPLFACALNNGIYRPADAAEMEEVYQALRKNHFPGGLMGKCGYEHTTCSGGGIEDYIARGYIPEDLPRAGMHANGAAQTIEHAFNDWALAQVAHALGKGEDAALFEARSRNYRHLFDSSVGFCRPRGRDGAWLPPEAGGTEPFDPYSRKGWTEANAWTYTFQSVHDVPGMIASFGSTDAFCAKLEEAFRHSEPTGFFAPRDQHHSIPLDFGNEPALAAAHLFQLAGRPERTNYWLRRVMEECKSGNAPEDTWGGDEDQGTMGAWSVLVAIGLFSVTGACERRGRYQVTAPLFDRVTIRLVPRYCGGERLFTIITEGLDSVGAEALVSASLEGCPLEQINPELRHNEIIAGGELRVRLLARLATVCPGTMPPSIPTLET